MPSVSITISAVIAVPDKRLKLTITGYGKHLPRTKPSSPKRDSAAGCAFPDEDIPKFKAALEGIYVKHRCRRQDRGSALPQFRASERSL